MQRITEIRLRNFRAFGDREEVIDLSNGQNLLVYGENGSGKSSLCSALITLLDASLNQATNFAVNKFLPENEVGYISVTFSDREVPSSEQIFEVGKNPFINTAYGNSMLRKARVARGYLSYQEIVRTYLLSEDDGEKLYDLLITTLLSDHKLQKYNNILSEVWKQLLESVERKPRPFVRRIDTENEKRELVREFNLDLVNTLYLIVLRINYWLGFYFNDPLVLWFDLRFTLNPNRSITPELKLSVEFEGKPLGSDYSTVLNEARLSAIAICFYLSAILAKPEPDDFKTLILDDVCIGLDTNNRLPLLRLLKSEFEDAGYQIVFTTYDRELFSLAADWFERHGRAWRQLEMYEGTPETIPGEPLTVCPFLPVLITKTGNLDKARDYLRTKDYPAAGNYLRKEMELVLHKYLPLSFCITGEGERKMRDLNGLLDSFKNYYELIGHKGTLDELDFTALASTFRRIIFNPASHQDLRSPLYRSELLEALEFLERLKRLPVLIRKTLLPRGSILVYQYSYLVDANGLKQGYRAEYELTEDLCVLTSEGNAPQLLDCKHKLRGYTWNEEVHPENPAEAEFKLSDRPARIQKFINRKTQNTIEVDWQRDFFTIGNQQLLSLPFSSEC